jgi:alanine dehydrogenase
VTDARWITEADVVDLVDLPAAVGAVRAGFASEATGAARSMAKTHVTWGGGDTLHAIGAVSDERCMAVTKTWAHTGGGATPFVVMWDSAGGDLVAVIEAFALGQLRTAAVSGVATDLLAPSGPVRVGIAGSGRQALPQVAAVAAVRDVVGVTVHSPTAEHRERFAAQLEEELDVPATSSDDVRGAIADADVAILVTRARSPFVTAAMTKAGSHVNAVGAITPERREFEAALLDRCATVVVDNVDQARRLSAELMERYAEDDEAWASVRPLAELVASGERRPPDADVTLFKALGTGLADLAVAVAVHDAAVAAGVGRSIAQPVRAHPHLRAHPREVHR